MRENRFWVFSGTIGRLNYALNGIIILCLLTAAARGYQAVESYLPLWAALIVGLSFMGFFIWAIYAAFCNAAKRVRDIRGMDKPVWTWIVGAMIPIVGMYFSFRLFFSRGKKLG